MLILKQMARYFWQVVSRSLMAWGITTGPSPPVQLVRFSPDHNSNSIHSMTYYNFYYLIIIVHTCTLVMARSSSCSLASQTFQRRSSRGRNWGWGYQRFHASLPSVSDFPYHPNSEFHFPKRSFKIVSSAVSSLWRWQGRRRRLL